MDKRNSQSEGITWISPQSLIRLRLDATRLPLQNSKIHARQGGAYLSSFKGRGMEYDESRLYLPGDDIRNMDWRVTARTGTAHTKVYREERERPVLIWLDLNASMFFATRGSFKAVIAARIAALLAWSASMHNDRLGALVFSGKEHIELKPRRGKAAVLELIGRACRHPAWDKFGEQANGEYPLAMSRLRKVTRPGSLLFLISDFRGLEQHSENSLINIARHNDVVLIQVYDPVEQSLPVSGSYKVSDGKREIELNTADPVLRQQYAQRFIDHQSHIETLCRQHRMYYLPVSTTDDLVSSLQLGLGLGNGSNSQFRTGKP